MKAYFLRLSRTKKVAYIAILLFSGWGAYKLWFAPTDTTYDLATVARGAIVQKVSVTGNTAPVKDYHLAFESGGMIAAVNYEVGAHVAAGAALVRLDTSDLQAQLAQAQANVSAQDAKLRALQAGSRPEDIQASRAALAKAQQDLANMYSDVSDVLNDAYAKANDAVRNQLSAFFTSAETANPQLSFAVSNSQTANDVQFKRLQAGNELAKWQQEITATNAASPAATLEAYLSTGSGHLGTINALLVSAGQALIESTNLTAGTISTYKTALTAASTETNTAAANVNNSAQGLASQKITIQQLQAQLDLKLAGYAPEEIAAQKAAVDQAAASAQGIEVKIAKASLVAPVAGVVTVQNAKVGQIASAGAEIVALLSDSGLEVEAKIPEADIGKVNMGDPAVMTLDAFPGETFRGKVVYVEPGETVIEGVPTYKTTFQFDNLGPQIKPGMTANIDITADQHQNVLYIPQRAVTTEANGVSRSVMVLHQNNPPSAQLEKRPVVTGLRDTEGNIEIVSGLTEGEVVLRSPR